MCRGIRVHYSVGLFIIIIIIFIIFLLFELFTPALVDGFSLEFKWHQVSSCLQDFPQSDLKKDVVWIVSPLPLISKSSSPCTNPLVTVPRAPLIIGIIVTFMIHRFFNSRARSWYLSFFLLSFNCTQWSVRIANSKFFFLLLIITRSDSLAESWWSVFICKSLRSLCVSGTNSVLYIYHLFE